MIRLLFLFIGIGISLPVFGKTAEAHDTIPYGDNLNDNLVFSVYNQDYQKVKKYIGEGAQINHLDPNGYTPLMYATESNNLPITDLLLSNGADPNLTSSEPGTPTPLIMASQRGYVTIVRLLLLHNAELSKTDLRGASALHYAVLYNDTTLTQILLLHGANVNQTTREGETPLLIACYNGYDQIFEQLIQFHANVEIEDHQGFTPLMVAAQNGYYHLVFRLLQQWVQVNHQNRKGFSALSLALSKGNVDIANLLILNEANLQEKNTVSLNPRGIAKIYHQPVLLDTLKKQGAKPNYLPYFSGFCPEIGMLINSKDLRTGLSISRIDLKYNLCLGLHYYFRPSAIPVLVKYKDNSYFQFWERRHQIGLSIDKSLEKTIGNKQSLGIYMGTNYDFHFGYYRGTSIPIKKGLLLSPYGGIFYKNHALKVKLFYQYTPYHIQGLSNECIGISFMYQLWTHPQKIDKKLMIAE